MVKRLLSDREGLAVVIGEAGTGKSYAILAAARGWSEAGIDLQVAAPTWRAANVLRAEGLRATSVASLLGELERAEQAENACWASGSVLLIDEAGMVDTATLARLVHHAEEANAKLVLVGDPEQLGEIEAGGLFRALAERTDPIHLDEVIRHEHELDREAARLIREGEGAEALDLYRSEERVVVAPDAQARREAMVAEWHESFSAGEDAVMVAKQNVEVERLNAMARQLRREAGQLGEQEIEVGEARFAAGDQVITRVNDRAADIYNRERWQVAEVDPEERRVVLRASTRRARSRSAPTTWRKTNPHSDAPALQHAYAITTYSAQGTTVDRAFVAADPSMDKQELYVAASRTRGETTIYATPEIQVEREEFAPADPYLRKGIPHIAEASERDRAQRAAHDEALRSELRGLPSDELRSRRAGLASEARGEAQPGAPPELGSWIERQEEALDHAIRRREAAEAAPRKVRREALPEAEVIEADCRKQVEELHAELRGMPPVRHEARAELAQRRPRPLGAPPARDHRRAARSARTTSSGSLGSARATPSSARCGTAASPGSRATAKSTESRTHNMPSDERATGDTTGVASRSASAYSNVRPSYRGGMRSASVMGPTIRWRSVSEYPASRMSRSAGRHQPPAGGVLRRRQTVNP